MAEQLIKNMEKAVPQDLAGMVEYETGQVVSLTLAQKPGAGITLFAFDREEEIGTHAAGGDAMANVLEGEAEITVGGVTHLVRGGQSILMPAGVPHSLKARTRFKMMLVVIFPEKN